VNIKRQAQRTFLHFLYADLFTILTPEYIGASSFYKCSQM